MMHTSGNFCKALEIQQPGMSANIFSNATNKLSILHYRQHESFGKLQA